MNISIRPMLVALALLPLVTGYCQNKDFDPSYHYSVEMLQTDFRTLRASLEKTHPQLYLYTPKNKLDRYFDSLYQSITHPMTEFGFYALITLLNAKIKDGHTQFLPGRDAMDHFNRKGLFFPFYVAISTGRLFVNMNCSPDTSIKEGAEVLSINGTGTADILNRLLVRQVRDGDSKTYPLWILDHYFKEYFSFSFGQPGSYSITYKISKSIRRTTLNALSKDSINFYRRLKYAHRVQTTTEKQGIVLNINKERRLATLSIKSFDKDILQSVYHQEFDNTIEAIFLQIDRAGIQNLILDVRDNQGGDFEPGKKLLSYLIRQPVHYLPGSEETGIIHPGKNSFSGKLLILINGGSFSSTAILCSYLDLTKRGIFIGDETAGNKVLISGDPIEIILPNTKIACEISTRKYSIRNAANHGHGVVPTHYKTPAIAERVSGKDPAMEFALGLIPGHH